MKVNMMFETSKAHPLVYEALDYRSLRQDMIASNIANVDTPYYRPRDIDFEHYLARESARIFDNQASLQLEMAQTSRNHLSGLIENNQEDGMPTNFFRDGHLARNDGNSVDLDVETSEMGKNSIMYQALTTALKKHKGIFAYAVDSGKNL
ncbi:flagellar basal body rod protein FlgB [Helicobacter sp. faydin-H20]|uniref:flagellar basal body rod protein FlgB n=1 Tax=Helicobacter anatolicus TaxID=2905874 RepID=UPI001E35A0CE|nr:flagellar basal body rod protein FlgB [Helicobacter anatolicus]MCE3037447.1 flagellar basal body rod protein FlgB [Helicobacter anatolicus]MCE3038967.1 flagellar basal body rod protein FlgB [Helicobacter anatolicus]